MKHHIKILFLVFLVFAVKTGKAQTISNTSISGGSGFISNNIIYNYNIGQLTVADNKFIVPIILNNETDKKTDSISSQNFDNQTIINSFPNPATNYLNVVITSKYEIETINISIFNIEGKEQKTTSSTNSNSNYSTIKINVSNLKTGSYIAKISINNSYIKHFTFIKK